MSVLSVLTVSLFAAGTASAGTISTPSGLNPGDQFRTVFVTSTTTNATSSDLLSYDSFVSNDANGATYNGTLVTWKAIVSSATTNASDHIGLQSSSTVPLYLVDGTLVSAGNLWSQTLLSSIDTDLNGAQYNTAMMPTQVWTGTNANGQSLGGISSMGGTGTVYGSTVESDLRWTMSSSADPQTTRRLYGISDVLTVVSPVPEPSTAMLAGLGGLAALAYSFNRKRNSCRR